MTIHKEGYPTIAITALVLIIINIICRYFFEASFPWLTWIIIAVSVGLWLFIISFFRVPNRTLTLDEKLVVAPADGKVVVIEEVTDTEYFANVHVNRNPISGEVKYSKYHKGKYLVAWHPKSSTENERHSTVISNGEKEILVKQIAGALAKRIVNYLNVGQKVEQCAEMGFIKFGSRVDVLLPLGTEVNVSLNQTVKGGVTVLAKL
jgi:phosphatidylserine decarboxylase